MRYKAYYIVTAKPELIEQLNGHADRGFAAVLTETVLLENEEGGRTAWGANEHTLQMKLLWLASLREYTPLSNDEDALALLGSASISTQMFDRWWIMQRLGVEDTASALAEYLPAVAQKIEQTGNILVDEWLNSSFHSLEPKNQADCGPNPPLHK
ncbi:hypothetical protein [Uliginosibacterium gangwonense]|uniref:hypothetical protein n=1 Tax=Uliginosibacterium gangwonense TaxID=392736 RepID=UPI00035E55A9|nr:hypothetical protein [Uliginosibacterium gangwonense]